MPIELRTSCTIELWGACFYECHSSPRDCWGRMWHRSPDGKTCPSCWWHSGTLSRLLCLEHIQGIQLPYVPLRSRVFLEHPVLSWWKELFGKRKYFFTLSLCSHVNLLWELFLILLLQVSLAGRRGNSVSLLGCCPGGSERRRGTAWSPQYCSCLRMAESRGLGKPGKAALHWLIQSCLQPLRLGTWACVSGRKKCVLIWMLNNMYLLLQR